ncbi:AB hydrolase-1 domain-containing protein [Mycena chlorophos]|uniref:AB hydrolase-1 domain-containing protein n=1 Tax=Mycena chlorophos TaxID=658473 RepID=A0A8H6WIG9_MYCCL|nr:AB hydrolase-1 domain-containing protein [Mycena chlorophos]
MARMDALSLMIVFLGLTAAVRAHFASRSSDGFAWSEARPLPTDNIRTAVNLTQIGPSEALVWTRCYEDRECARLKVPLDYTNPKDASASIALIRIRAKVSHDSPRYRGPVLVNPGGPGESGVDFVRSVYGDLISVILGPEFDIVGFDPRGIARSTPAVSFFRSRTERALWFPGFTGQSLNASTDSLARTWAQGTLLGQLAGERDVDGSLKFINTENTARDLLRIVEAYGRQKLMYWGFSYGTVLGATFAAMFPDKVERLVIDGVVDSEDWHAADWTHVFVDANRAWQSFADGCVAAGPSRCAFYAPTAEELLSSVDAIHAHLRKRPIPVHGTTEYGLVDFSLLRATIFQSLYSPYVMFPQLAHALAGMAEGDGTALLELHAKYGRKPFECVCGEDEQDYSNIEAVWAVFCNDATRIPAEYDAFVKDYHSILAVSPFADLATLKAGCLAWPDYPKADFRGPFTANTSFPLLIIGNTADPVTPLSGARNMSKGFVDSVLLTQDSAGHCSVSAPSLCTQKHVRAYFQDGKLPHPGTLCDVDVEMFPSHTDDENLRFAPHEHQKVFDVPNQRARTTQLSAEDSQLLDALRKLATRVPRQQMFTL